MKLLLLTDIHLTEPGERIADRDPNANFDRALDHALAHHADAEAMIVTGDLSEHGRADDYRRLKARIAEVPMPVELLLGNHDERAAFLDVFPNLAGEGGFVQRVVALSLGHAVLLDTHEPGTDAGGFGGGRLDWLDRQLHALPGPVWLFLHHHPVPLGLPPLDRIMLLDHADFAATLKPHRGKIAHIFHGHSHLPLSGSLHGIPLSSGRGTNQALWPDFGEERRFNTVDLPEAYSVVIADGERTIVHMVEFGHRGEVRRSP